jgi:diguanylate cyclase (GGDEF)-like protein
VFGAKGEGLLDIAAARPLAWPVVSRRAPVLQNGNRLGSVEISRSLLGEVATTLGVAVVSFSVGLLLQVVLRVVPLRLMREALDLVAYLSAHDLLTGLPNRAVLVDRLEQALSLGRRVGAVVATFCLDLDRFKEVNDTLGHAAGDALLREVVARLGGDEFVVIQPGARQPHDAESLAARLLEAVREPVLLDEQQVCVGLSIGIALSEPGTEPDELIKQADVALYQVKAHGRGGICFFARR